MKVSIALATYNGAKYLQTQLDSYVAQTRPPDELVATDDASDDATWEVLTRFQHDAPFEVRLSRNTENLGYTANFAKTLALTTGDVIFLSDQDDYWLPEKLERMLSEFDQHPDALVVTCDQALADANLRLTGQTSMGQHLRVAGGVAGDMFAIGCCTALRASARDLMLPLPPSAQAHDVWLHFLGEYLGRRVVPESLQHHRRHGENTSVYPYGLTRRPSPLGLIQQRWRAPTAALLFRQHHLDLLSDRLSDVATDAVVPRTSALERIEAERTVIAERLAIVRQSRIRRVGLVLRLLRNGGYRRFSGWKSAGLDLLGPRASDASSRS